ncbi:cathepsin O-like, partial [Asbolus verrucosus]
MASWKSYLQALAYIALLFFLIPIKIDGPDEFDGQFQEYLKHFNKTYNDSVIYQDRLQAFKQSLETIKKLNLNKSNDSAHYGLTKYSDMLPEEFLHNHLQLNLSQRLFKYTKSHHKRSISNLPQKLDWRQKGVVTKIRNQGNCGACWAHSAVETIESMHAIKTGKLEEFSVQEIIDCAGYDNDGCNGGDTCTLLSWMKDTNFTLHHVSEYTKGHCKINSSNGVQIEDFVCERYLSKKLVGSENVILELLVLNGPLAVAINAQTWQNYIGGVIEYHCDGDPSKLNHAVQIVGYDLTANIPYYIVRNTWGEDFGDQGYLYI